MRALRIPALFTALLAAMLLLGTVGASVATAAPGRFAPHEIVGPYPSDLPEGGTYVSILDGFDDIRGNRALMDTNLQTVQRVNNAATEAEQADAINVNYDDPLLSLSSALGNELGATFRELLAGDRIPKVSALASGYTARVGLPLAHTLVEKEIFNYPRPFVVAPQTLRKYDRPGGDIYQGLAGNGSYPSGHTNIGYWNGALMAYWLPEIGSQILARGLEIGNTRIVLGVHYPLDIMGGRIMAQKVIADRLGDPAFARLIDAAGAQLRQTLSDAVGEPIGDYLRRTGGAQSTAAAVDEHRGYLAYDFEPIDPGLASDIPVAAANLLKSRFPNLSVEQRRDILRQTALPAGYPLDKAGPNGGWVRIDLAAAFATQP